MADGKVDEKDKKVGGHAKLVYHANDPPMFPRFGHYEKRIRLLSDVPMTLRPQPSNRNAPLLQIKEMLKSMDSDGDGMISATEMVRVVQKKLQVTTPSSSPTCRNSVRPHPRTEKAADKARRFRPPQGEKKLRNMRRLIVVVVVVALVFITVSCNSVSFSDDISD